MLTSEQIRQARELLEWKLVKLAQMTDLDVSIILRAEGLGRPALVTPRVSAVIQHALEQAGIEFTAESTCYDGFRIRKQAQH